MEIYKGASAFAGIAIGKIRFYRKGEYQIRQHQADDVKKELKNFDVARRHVMQTLKEEYDRMSEKQMDTADPELDMEPQPLDRIVKMEQTRSWSRQSFWALAAFSVRYRV